MNYAPINISCWNFIVLWCVLLTCVCKYCDQLKQIKCNPLKMNSQYSDDLQHLLSSPKAPVNVFLWRNGKNKTSKGKPTLYKNSMKNWEYQGPLKNYYFMVVRALGNTEEWWISCNQFVLYKDPFNKSAIYYLFLDTVILVIILPGYFSIQENFLAIQKI